MNTPKTFKDLPPALQQTPWGQAQHGYQESPGIWRIETAGHGGYWLHEIRLKQLPPEWKGFVGYSGSYQWFEEDCDWAVVAVCFPYAFSEYLRYCAFKTLATLDYCKERFEAFLKSEKGRALFLASVQWEKDNGQRFQMGSLSTSGQGWDCSAYRIDGQERLVWHQADYPSYVHPFEKAELAAFAVKSEPFPPPARTFADLDPANRLEAA